MLAYRREWARHRGNAYDQGCGPALRLHFHVREVTVDPMSDTEAPTTAFNPFSPEFRDDPYPSYRTMRDAGPVIRTPFGLLTVTRYQPVDRILRSSAFRTPRGYRDANDPAGPPLFDPTGPLSLHRRHWLLFQSGDAH